MRLDLEEHTSSYVGRIRRSSKSLKNAPLKHIVAVSLLIAAEYYENLRKQEGELK